MRKAFLSLCAMAMLWSCSDDYHNTFDFKGDANVRVTRTVYAIGSDYAQDVCDTSFLYRDILHITVDTLKLNCVIDYSSMSSRSEAVYYDGQWREICYTKAYADSIVNVNLWILTVIK